MVTGRMTARPRRRAPLLTALLAGALLVGALSTATPAEAATCTSLPQAFSDVPTSHPFCNEIGFIAELGAMHGYPDGTFRPSTPMTRQAVAGTIYNMLYEPLPAGPHPCPPATFMPFTDIPLSHPFCEQIEVLARDGVLLGFPGPTFRPDSIVTRQAASHWLAHVQAAGEPDYDPCLAAPFPDVPVSHPFCEQIQYLKENGVALGYADGGFHPGQTQTRQAFAAFAYRVYF